MRWRRGNKWAVGFKWGRAVNGEPEFDEVMMTTEMNGKIRKSVVTI